MPQLPEAENRTTEGERRGRRRFQFSLGFLLMLTVACAMAMAWWADHLQLAARIPWAPPRADLCAHFCLHVWAEVEETQSGKAEPKATSEPMDVHVWVHPGEHAQGVADLGGGRRAVIFFDRLVLTDATATADAWGYDSNFHFRFDRWSEKHKWKVTFGRQTSRSVPSSTW
jgi:hypothetical protein